MKRIKQCRAGVQLDDGDHERLYCTRERGHDGDRHDDGVHWFEITDRPGWVKVGPMEITRSGS